MAKKEPPILPASQSLFVRWQNGWRGQSLAIIALLLGGIGGGLTIGTLIQPRPASIFAEPPSSPSESRAEKKRVEPRRLGPDAILEESRSTPDPGLQYGTELTETEDAPPTAPEPTPTNPIPLPPPYTGASPAWRRHAIATPPSEGQARIALIIDDMGVDQGRSAQVVNLAGPLTLSYLPYAHRLPQQTAQAHQHGHELLVHMPMQPSVAADPGPDALTVTLPLEEIQRRLRRNLSKFDGYVGINNHMGSQFTTWEAGMRMVIAELRARGLIWFDSRTSSRTLGSKLARSMALPYIDRDIFLDDDPSLEGVRRRLNQLEAIAHRTGKGAAIGHPKDNTITALKEWLPTLSSKGLTLVPITNLVILPAEQTPDSP